MNSSLDPHVTLMDYNEMSLIKVEPILIKSNETGSSSWADYFISSNENFRKIFSSAATWSTLSFD